MSDITKNINNLEIPYFGLGGCAVVYKADFIKEGEISQRMKVAVKVPFVRIGGIEADGNGIEDERLIRRRSREVEVWVKAKHPNILPFLGTCRMSDISSGMHPEGTVGLVSPFCVGGSILDYVKNHRTADRVYLLAQCAAALQYLHTRNPPIIHGDIKGINILIDNNGTVRLSDFGISRILTTKGYTTDAAFCSCRWSSTELLGIEDDKGDDQDGSTFSHLRTEASDVWAFGMTCLEVLTGKPPFSEIQNDTAVFMALMKHTRPKRSSCSAISDAVWLLLEACWKTAVEERPSAVSLSLVWDLLYGFKGTIVLSDKCVSALLGWMARNVTADGAQSPPHNVSHIPSATGRQNPYVCNWPVCWSSFATIDQCIEHECHEFMAWRVINLPPALRL